MGIFTFFNFSGSIRPGIVFDDITPHPSVPKVKEGFGSRKIRLKADKSAKPSPSNSRQATLYDKKTVAPPAANGEITFKFGFLYLLAFIIHLRFQMTPHHF